jgi:hypothetical protein
MPAEEGVRSLARDDIQQSKSSSRPRGRPPVKTGETPVANPRSEAGAPPGLVGMGAGTDLRNRQEQAP